MPEQNPLLETLEPVRDIDGEGRIDLTWESKILSQVVQSAIASNAATRTVTRSMNQLTAIGKIGRRIGEVFTVESFNGLAQDFTAELAKQLSGTNLNGLADSIKIKFKQDNPEDIERLVITRRMIQASVDAENWNAAIAFVVSATRIVKDLFDNSDNTLTRSEVLSRIQRMVADASHWLNTNTDLDGDTEIANALHSACQVLAKQLQPKETQK